MATHARTTGPVTTAIRSVEREHEPNRRAMILGALLAASLSSVPVAAATTETASPELLRLIAKHDRISAILDAESDDGGFSAWSGFTGFASVSRRLSLRRTRKPT